MQIRANEQIKISWIETARGLMTDPRMAAILRASMIMQVARKVSIFVPAIGAKEFMTSTLGMDKGPFTNTVVAAVLATTSIASYPLDLANTYMNRGVREQVPIITIRSFYQQATQDLYRNTWQETFSQHIRRGILYRVASKSCLLPLVLALQDITKREDMDRSIFDIMLHSIGGGIGSATVGALVGTFRGQAVRMAGMMGYHGLWMTALASIFMAREDHFIDDLTEAENTIARQKNRAFASRAPNIKNILLNLLRWIDRIHFPVEYCSRRTASCVALTHIIVIPHHLFHYIQQDQFGNNLPC